MYKYHDERLRKQERGSRNVSSKFLVPSSQFQMENGKWKMEKVSSSEFKVIMSYEF